jgi:hypothetical protein
MPSPHGDDDLLGLLESSDESARGLVFEWLRDCRGEQEDKLLSLFEFSRKQLFLRDGFVPSGGSSRRASVDPVKGEVIREVAEGLRHEKSEYVASFIKEWINTSDDPDGMILVTPTTCISSVSSSVTISAVFHDGLKNLLSWDNEYLSMSQTELVSRSVEIFHLWGFFSPASPYSVPRDKTASFIKLIGRNYLSENPYHNMHHAHSVLSVTGNLIKNCCTALFSPVEELAILMAALCHDVGHRGLNSDFYIKTRHPLAIQYNDMSVLENMHCSLAFDLLRSSAGTDFTCNFSDDQWSLFRRTFINSVLATDMKSHFDLTSKVSAELKADALSNPESVNGETKKTIYQSVVHAADLANPLMPTKQSYDWAYRVVQEMYEQGRLEERSGYQVAPFMQHRPSETVEFAKLQISFVGFIVAPLWRSLAAVWPVLDDRIVQMEKNLQFWQELRDRAPSHEDAYSDVTRRDSRALK